jgi:magnesium transporter
MSDNLENIRQFMEQYSDEDLKRMVNEIPMDDLIEYWYQLTPEEELRFFSLLKLDRKVGLMSSLPPSTQETLMTALSVEHKKILLEEMEPDDLTDFMQAISPEVRNAVWKSLSEEAKQETLFLLRFDEDDAAGLMTPRYLALSSSLTVSQALSWVRKNAAVVETVYYIYVVDQLKRLRETDPRSQRRGPHRGYHGEKSYNRKGGYRPGRSGPHTRNPRFRRSPGCR